MHFLKRHVFFLWAVTADASLTKPWLSVLSSVWKEHLHVPAQLLSKRICLRCGTPAAGFTGLTLAMCSTGAHRRRLITPSLCFPAKSYIPPGSCVLFIYTLMLKWTLLQFKSQVLPLCLWAWRTHPPSLSKTRYCHNWPVHQVSCWKSRFCTDVRPVALCNHVHTQPGFNYTLEGKTEGLSGFYFKVPFQGKLAAQARI